MLGTPSTDPDVRDYRIRLLPWVTNARRWLGYGCQMRGRGSQRAVKRRMRVYDTNPFWLRHINMTRHTRPSPWWNAPMLEP